MPANYNPTFVGYTNQGAFRFWCQKVLPLVYDDSLSYYELLNKVVDYLNNAISDVANVETNLEALHTAYGQLEGYVNERVTEQRQYIVLWTEQMQEQFNTLQSFVDNYFDNLDVQEEINTKLDEMATGGQLSALIRPLIAEDAPAIITQWLDDNVDPSTTPIVDNSLSITGAAADAKVVGDNFKVTTIPRAIATEYASDPSVYSVDPETNIVTVDLNGVKKAGRYLLTGSWVKLHCPITTNTTLYLVVDRFSTTVDGRWTKQTLYLASAPFTEIYTRQASNNGTFSDWYKPPVDTSSGKNLKTVYGFPSDQIYEVNGVTTVDLDKIFEPGHYILDNSWNVLHSPITYGVRYLIVDEYSHIKDGRFSQQTIYSATSPFGLSYKRQANVIIENEYTYGDWSGFPSVASAKDVIQVYGKPSAVVYDEDGRTVVELNQVYEQGYYLLNSTWNVKNSPITSGLRNLIVSDFSVQTDNRFKQQIIYKNSDPFTSMYIRESGLNGEWGEWKQLNAGGNGDKYGKMLVEVNSTLAGTIYKVHTPYDPNNKFDFDRYASWGDSPYSQLAIRLGVPFANVNMHGETIMHSSTGFVHPETSDKGGFVDYICGNTTKGIPANENLGDYDYIFTIFWRRDLTDRLIGDIDDLPEDNTLTGAVRQLLEYINTENSSCRLILASIIPDYPNTVYGDTVFSHEYDYVNPADPTDITPQSTEMLDDVMHKMAAKYHFTYIDYQDMNLSYHWRDFCPYNDGEYNGHLKSANAYRRIGQYLGDNISSDNIERRRINYNKDEIEDIVREIINENP